MPKSLSPLVVSLRQDADTTILEAGRDVLHMKSSHPAAAAYPDRADFAAFYFLPIAMRTGRPLHIRAAGSAVTVDNVARLSHIWASWLPGHFSPVTLSFDRLLSPGQTPPRPLRDLCFYSGGIDSTYTLLARHRQQKQQDVLTIFGMDYDLDQPDRFRRYLERSDPFARHVAGARIILEMDAYALYRKYRVNPKSHNVSHIFALAGSGFFHAGRYSHIIIAADYRLDQQFVCHPWGNNSASNPLFDDGATCLLTDSDTLSRSDKLSLILQSPEALRSLCFCFNDRAKPDNCGACPKCMRTKLMFLARTGQIPPLFLSNDIPRNWMRSFNYEDPHDLAFLMETVAVAKLYGATARIPFFEENEDRLHAYCRSRSRLFSSFKVGSFLRRKRLQLRHFAHRFDRSHA